MSKSEGNYPTVEKEAASIIEAVQLEVGSLFIQSPVHLKNAPAFMFDQPNRGKIKNSKIQAWRAELGMFSYKVKHRSGKENVAADALWRVCSVAGRPSSLKGLHESLGHPGITRLWHFVRSKNLPFPTAGGNRHQPFYSLSQNWELSM